MCKHKLDFMTNQIFSKFSVHIQNTTHEDVHFFTYICNKHFKCIDCNLILPSARIEVGNISCA